MAHVLATGRVAVSVGAAGESVLAVVPSGHWWELFGFRVSCVPITSNVSVQLRLKDAAGVVRVAASVPVLTPTSPASGQLLMTKMNAGDQLVAFLGRAVATGFWVSYVQR